MIVPQTDINFVVGAKCRRLLLPVERGEVGELLPCPVEAGEVFKLWDGRPFVKGVTATALVIDQVDAATVESAITAGHKIGARAWLIRFALGDHSEFFDKHRERYLKAKGVGLTANPDRAAKGEPAVTTEEEMQLARRARERRQLEEEQNWRMQKQAMEQAIAALRARNTDREVESDLRFMERRLAKMDRRRGERAA